MKSSRNESAVADLAQRRMKKGLEAQHPQLILARPYADLLCQNLSKLYKGAQATLIRYEREKEDVVVCSISVEYDAVDSGRVVATGNYRIHLQDGQVVNVEAADVTYARR